MKLRTTLVLPLVLLVVLCMSAVAVLAQTPAGTQIRNRSSATFEDLSGNTYTTISNEVVTIVLPVYGVSILPDDSGETPPVTPAIQRDVNALDTGLGQQLKQSFRDVRQNTVVGPDASFFRKAAAGIASTAPAPLRTTASGIQIYETPYR